MTIVWDANDFPNVARQAARGEANYQLVLGAEDAVDDDVPSSLGLPRIAHELALFGWQDGSWQQVKSWPIPPDLETKAQR